MSKLIRSLLLLLLCTASIVRASVETSISIEKRFESLSVDTFVSFNTDNIWQGDIKYLACLHYIKGKQWDNCIVSLKHIEKTEPDYRPDFRNILYGIAYQNSDDLQLAFNHYRQVPSHSNYYIHAQLYIALLHANYGRPNKANRIISTLLRSETIKSTPEMTNKLHLIQGHVHFLNKNFSASRKALKKISADSQYLNDSTAALALGHIYLGNFEPAKNYLSYLTRQSIKDTSADTAYILLAFANSQENYFSEATITSYKKAISYYKRRISEITFLLDDKAGLAIINGHTSDHMFIVENNMLDLSHNIPGSFLANYASLDDLSQRMGSAGTGNKLYENTAHLHKQYEQAVIAEARHQLTLRKAMLARYLNRCMYTLARLLYQNKL